MVQEHNSNHVWIVSCITRNIHGTFIWQFRHWISVCQFAYKLNKPFCQVLLLNQLCIIWNSDLDYSIVSLLLNAGEYSTII